MDPFELDDRAIDLADDWSSDDEDADTSDHTDDSTADNLIQGDNANDDLDDTDDGDYFADHPDQSPYSDQLNTWNNTWYEFQRGTQPGDSGGAMMLDPDRGHPVQTLPSGGDSGNPPTSWESIKLWMSTYVPGQTDLSWYTHAVDWLQSDQYGNQWWKAEDWRPMTFPNDSDGTTPSGDTPADSTLHDMSQCPTTDPDAGQDPPLPPPTEGTIETGHGDLPLDPMLAGDPTAGPDGHDTTQLDHLDIVMIA